MSSAGARSLNVSPDMVVAIRDGIVVDDYGTRKEIVAGQTYWHRYQSSELRRPEVAALFGITREGFNRTASSSATPSPKVRFYPTLPATREVTLSRFAASTILSTIRSAPRGLEVGGWLCADRRNPDYIRLATEPGGDATFARSSGMLGKDVLRDLQATAPHLVPIGDYHFHPEGGSQPSPADRATWAGNVDLNRLGFNVSIIATPGSSWLADPTLTGWLTIREGKSLVCERVHLKEL